ncbi:MAG: glycosyltransferase family 9 protein [Hymenobacteraceae bacterium]|nr:glycosyltransferase family 9 protein [Hymenobacteraceae bacterium]
MITTYLISRPDAIGDVVLTLPMAGWLKQQHPGCRVVFLGRAYTAAVIAACAHVDAFVDADELRALPPAAQVARVRALALDVWIHALPDRHLARLAQRAGVSVRVGTNRRWWHWLTCNRLVSLSRKNSDLHEAELNLRLLAGVGITEFPALAAIPALYGLTHVAPMTATVRALLGPAPAPGRLWVVLHPKSRGSGREWPLTHYAALARGLHAAGHRVLLSGSATEADLLTDFRRENAAFLTDLTGRLTLSELLAVLREADALVASGTGPLHLAAALGRRAVGLFPPLRPIHPGRWGALGERAVSLITPARTSCNDCVGRPAACHCLPEISPAQVAAALEG